MAITAAAAGDEEAITVAGHDEDIDRTRDGDPAAETEGDSAGQVLGDTVPLSPDVTRADPGSPETGAVRDAEGRPSAAKPMTDS